MFARFLGRQQDNEKQSVKGSKSKNKSSSSSSSAGNKASSKNQEETPEIDELQNQAQDENNQFKKQPEQKKSIATVVTDKSNNDNNEAVTSVDDIEVSVASKPIAKAPVVATKVSTTKAAPSSTASSAPPASGTGWIYSYEKSQVWPQSLSEITPPSLISSFKSRELKFTPLVEKMTGAEVRRGAILEARADACNAHSQQVSHAAMRIQDLKESSLMKQATKLEAKLQEAAERREAILGDKRLIANVSSGYPLEEESYYDGEASIEVPSRVESASRVRSAILQDISARASQQVEYARTIATEVANAEEEAASILEELSDQRLARAEVRRNIALDRKRLSCGRHGNYVQSVYLTNRYMERRSAQMIQHNLDAAAFRREVKLEEIKSNARQANLSAQFRAVCAYRLLDAKWLNYALKTTAAQTSAKMRRDTIRDAESERLHEAALRRADVAARHKLILSEKADTEYLEAKQRAAEYRREMHLYERGAIIKERAAILKSRKAAASTSSRRLARKELKNKLEAAARRRHVILSNRRAACATRNWHAKVLSDRQEEAIIEEAASRLQEVESKLEAAAHRREEYQHPIFAQLVSLRGARANQVLLAHQAYKKQISERKVAFDKIRVAALNQVAMNKSFERLSRVKRVQSNRQFMDTFYKQVIANTTTARQRGAELRRALYQDAVIASASETVERSLAARDRLEFEQDEAREILDIKLQNAEARRAEATNEKIGTALWFQGKVAVAKQKSIEEAQAKRYSIEEAVSNADLRRSILMTRSIQKNAKRNQRWELSQKEIEAQTQIDKEDQAIRAYNAESRREAVLMDKIETARNSSNRVTVARLEKRAEDVVDAAIRTAITKTMTKNAEVRRQGHLEDIQSQAANQVTYAKGVARYQKELQQVRAEVTLEQSKLRMLQTSKRRESLLSQRKLGHSTIEQLQPYAGLQIVGHSMNIIPNSA